MGETAIFIALSCCLSLSFQRCQTELTDVLWKLRTPLYLSHITCEESYSAVWCLTIMEVSALVLCNGLVLQTLALIWHLERNCQTVERQAQTMFGLHPCLLLSVLNSPLLQFLPHLVYLV